MARRRRYNPNQKRAKNGQWTKGARGAALSTGAATPAGGGTYKTAKQRRYEGYQKHLAQQAEIQAANKKKAARRKAIAGAALGAAAVGAIGVAGVRRRKGSMATVTPIRDDSVRVGRPSSRSGSPLATHNANIARETPSPKVNLVRDMPKAKPVKVAAGPNKMAGQMAGTKAPAAKKVAQNRAGVQNPTPAKVYVASKKGKNGQKLNGPRAAEVTVLKGNTLKEVAEVRKRRIADNENLNNLLMKEGLGIKWSDSGQRITDATANRKAAAVERNRIKGEKKRAENYKDTEKSIKLAAERAANYAKLSSTRRARAEDRYTNMLLNMRESGTSLKRNQRKYLSDLGL